MKKFFSFALVALLSLPLLAANSLPVRSMVRSEIQKTAAVRPAAKMHRAPQAVANMNFSATYVEAAYYGSYTEEVNDWVFFFVGNSSNILIYADVYGPADATHIDGTYSLSDGSIYEAFVVRAAADTVDVTSGTINVAHNNDGTYRFTVNLVGGGETFTLTQDLEVEAYDYLYYMYYQYGFLDDLSMVDIYLEDAGANPNPGGNDNPGTETGGDYSWEPSAATTINVVATDFQLQDYTDTYGEVLMVLQNSAYQLAIEMFLPALDANGNVPAGTYQINGSQDDNTVWASPGGDDQYDYGTFLAAGFNEQGYYTMAYYIVSGTVTVSYDANGNICVTLVGTSYNGSQITVTYGEAAAPGESAVENVELGASSKLFRDGQVLILKNGTLYNALGQTVE